MHNPHLHRQSDADHSHYPVRSRSHRRPLESLGVCDICTIAITANKVRSTHKSKLPDLCSYCARMVLPFPWWVRIYPARCADKKTQQSGLLVPSQRQKKHTLWERVELPSGKLVPALGQFRQSNITCACDQDTFHRFLIYASARLEESGSLWVAHKARRGRQ